MKAIVNILGGLVVILLAVWMGVMVPLTKLEQSFGIQRGFFAWLLLNGSIAAFAAIRGLCIISGDEDKWERVENENGLLFDTIRMLREDM